MLDTKALKNKNQEISRARPQMYKISGKGYKKTRLPIPEFSC